ncbi:hypothetical protein [uncultured Paraglaciecola sp.]|mgnify:CR=1 FL=1|uniref:hypothetical protein n=1 Tax=uncultured Paraglaciecola sp. TaxID=1765024 RepID=UPI002614D3BA|nr:hypothetical protein [uncultured Paraglaciecola sp.]
MIDRGQSRGIKQTITQVGTDTSSGAINVAGWDWCDTLLELTTGTGDCVFKFQVSYENGGQKYDLEVGGAVAITETATGHYAYRLELGAASELYMTATAIGTYDIDGAFYPFNRGGSS